MVYETGDRVFIIESSRIIRGAAVVKRSGEFYTLRFDDGAVSSCVAADCMQRRRKHNQLFQNPSLKIEKQDTVRHMIMEIK